MVGEREESLDVSCGVRDLTEWAVQGNDTNGGDLGGGGFPTDRAGQNTVKSQRCRGGDCM